MKIIEYAKEHPWTIAGIIGGVVVLYLLWNSGASDQTAIVQQTSYDPSVRMAELSLQAQGQQLQEKLAENINTTNASVAIAQLQANLGALQTSAGRDVSLAGISAQENVQLSGQQSQVQLAQVNAQTAIAQTNATRDIALGTAATYAHIADVNASTIAASYQAQVDIAQSHDAAQVAISTQQQKTARKSSDNGLFGSILGSIGAIAGIFSDSNLKLDVQTAGYDDKGRRWVSFRYTWDKPGTLRYGVIAQEVLRTDPKAVKRDPVSGFLKVNYSRLSPGQGR